MGQLYTTNWVVVAWRRNQGHLLILTVITLLSLWALNRVKVKIKYFWFVTWSRDRYLAWLCGGCLFILSQQSAKFGIHRPCESGGIIPLMCHLVTWFVCRVALWVGFPHPKWPCCKVWGPYALWKWNYNVFYLSRDRDIEVSRDFPLNLSYHSAKFGVHRPYGTGNNGVCNIGSNSISSSSSNAEVYKWRFERCWLSLFKLLLLTWISNF